MRKLVVGLCLFLTLSVQSHAFIIEAGLALGSAAWSIYKESKAVAKEFAEDATDLSSILAYFGVIQKQQAEDMKAIKVLLDRNEGDVFTDYLDDNTDLTWKRRFEIKEGASRLKEGSNILGKYAVDPWAEGEGFVTDWWNTVRLSESTKEDIGNVQSDRKKAASLNREGKTNFQMKQQSRALEEAIIATDIQAQVLSNTEETKQLLTAQLILEQQGKPEEVKRSFFKDAKGLFKGAGGWLQQNRDQSSEWAMNYDSLDSSQKNTMKKGQFNSDKSKEGLYRCLR